MATRILHKPYGNTKTIRGQRFTKPSLTQPGEAPSIRDLVRKFTNGLLRTDLAVPESGDDMSHDDLDIGKMVGRKGPLDTAEVTERLRWVNARRLKTALETREKETKEQAEKARIKAEVEKVKADAAAWREYKAKEKP